MHTLFWIVGDSFSTRLTMALLHFLWEGCLGGLLVIVGKWLLRDATARSRYVLNVATMLVMAACLPVTFLLLDTRETIVDHSAPVQSHEAPTIPEAQVQRPDSATIHALPDEPAAVGVHEPAREPEAETGTDPNPYELDGASTTRPAVAWLQALSSRLTENAFPVLSRWVTALYLTGVALILGRLLRGVCGGDRLRKLATPIKDTELLQMVSQLAHRLGLKVVPTIAWCEQISIPVVVGIVTPMILLPLAVASSLTPTQLQALLLHELSHIRRFDPVVNLLQRIVEAALFFHPLVWFVSRRISIERELAADDMVLAAGLDRPLYADALVRVAELASAISGPDPARRATVLGASGTNSSEFKVRVLRLLGESPPPKLNMTRVGIAVTLLLVAGGTFAWSQIDKSKSTLDRQSPADVVEAERSIPKELEPFQGDQTSLKTLDPRQSLVSQATPAPKSKPTVDPVPATVNMPAPNSFQGNWAVDSCQSEAATLKASIFEARRWRWSIKDAAITWGREGQQWRLSFQIDPSQTPKQIDLTFLDGPHKGEKCLGIYDWDGKEGKSLKILMQDPGAKVDRPTSFARTEGSQTSLITFHSIPPVDPVKELASFQGTWCFDLTQLWTWPQPIGVGTDSDGRESEKRWVVKGNQITWVGRDGERIYVTFTIDPFQAPKQIDFTFVNGPHQGKKSIGIYEPQSGNDNYLWLCMTDPGTDAPRPIDISAGSFKKQTMIGMHQIAPPEKPSAKKALERFQGIWQMTLCDSTLETFGATQQDASKWEWTIKGDEILWNRQGDVWKLKLEVDPSKAPKEIDLTYLSGPFMGAKCLGMYEFGGVDRQSLHIAIQDPGSAAPRPTEIAMNGSVKTGLIFLRPSKPSDAEREIASFQGTWTLRKFDTGNFDKNKDPGSWPLPAGKGPDKSGAGSELRWVVKGNEIAWTSRSGEAIKASFTIDPRKRPKQIDLTFLSGPDKGETCPGIYQRGDLDENILWLCMANPGSNTERPKEFSYEWGKGRSVLSLYPFEPSIAQSSVGLQEKPTPSAEPVLATPEKPIPKELEPFQGVWAMVSCDSETRILYAPQEVVRHWRWIVKGDQILWQRERQEWKLSFKVDPTKTPMEIDLTYLSGPFKGETCQGMYEWGTAGGKSLQISIQDPGAKVARPTSISMTGGGQTSLMSLNGIDNDYAVKQFQGSWSFEAESDAWPQPVGKKTEQLWVVKENEISWTSADGQVIKASFTLDSAYSPKHFDLTFLNGPHAGKKCLGLYDEVALGKKSFWLCLTEPGSKEIRPTDFTYVANAGRARILLEPVSHRP